MLVEICIPCQWADVAETGTHGVISKVDEEWGIFVTHPKPRFHRVSHPREVSCLREARRTETASALLDFMYARTQYDHMPHLEFELLFQVGMICLGLCNDPKFETYKHIYMEALRPSLSFRSVHGFGDKRMLHVPIKPLECVL